MCGYRYVLPSATGGRVVRQQPLSHAHARACAPGDQIEKKPVRGNEEVK